MISESDAQELLHSIGAALDGDPSGLIRAQQIAHELLTEVLPAWRWETTAAWADPTVGTSEPVVADPVVAELVVVADPELAAAVVVAG
jgi:hypothetical protein